MPRLRREVHEARDPRTPGAKARKGRRSSAAATAVDEGQAQGADVARGEVSAEQRNVDLGALDSAAFAELPGGSDPVGEEANGDNAANAAQPAQESAPADPDAVLALADLAISATCAALAHGGNVPPSLGKLSESERALLAPFSIGAARQLGDVSVKLEQYSGLIFAGLVGFFVFQRVRALKALEPKNEEAQGVDWDNGAAQPIRQSPPPSSSDLPGSPFG